MKVEPCRRLVGEVAVPGDKSISHRFAILGAMAEGRTEVANFSASADCTSTLACVSALGVEVRRKEARVSLESPGWRRLTAPEGPLDAGNSGTTIRLLSGLLAGRPMETRIGGDESLNRRPMGRIIRPLTAMGASISAREGEYPPLLISGTRLQALRYELPVASAQVKSCVLLAGLTANGRTTVIEPTPTRDHTERALPAFGVPVTIRGREISVTGPVGLKGAQVRVPGDLSSAVFFVVAGLLRPGSELSLPDVGVNPSRDGFLRLLEEAGAPVVRAAQRSVGGEPVCDLQVRGESSFLKALPSEVGGSLIPNVIDEIPILAVLASQSPAGLTVTGAGELRKKESDRIASVVSNLRAVGVEAKEFPDGFAVPHTPRIRGGVIRTFGDHRIAMAFAVLGLLSREGVEIDDPDCAGVSFPDFFPLLERTSER